MEVIENVVKRFTAIRKKSLDLCKPLLAEDYVVQPIADVSPPKWHLGHTTWFFEQFILKEHDVSYKIYNKNYNFIFNSYYESAGKRVLRTDRGNLTRPGVEDVFRYRDYVDTAMGEFLSTNQELSPRLAHILEIGLQHEQQHQELLVTDIKYILGHNPLFPVYKKDYSSNGTTNNQFFDKHFIAIEEGTYEIGASTDGFKFDNELGVHKVYLQPFQFMNRLITNGEYLEFMENGGYRNFKYWLSEGWDWVASNKIGSPMYWHKMDNKWFYFTLNGFKELDLKEPVTHVNYYEADAFANWKGKRLLTEFEWEVACKALHDVVPQDTNFLDEGHFKPVFAKNNATQLYGDVWEWTQSAYLPYPYFVKEEGALGEYNGKFMINQMVLRGGSCATMRDHIRCTYRNFFHPDKRWQFTGIRLGESI